MKPEGLVAIVTGGASGIGEATILELASRKCKVVIADLNKEAGNKLVEKIGNDLALFVETNVADEESVKGLINQAIMKFGAIHIIVNSAGIISAGVIISNKSNANEMMKVLKINVLGTFLVTKYAAIQMMKQDYISEQKEKGVIINLASVAGIEGQKGQTIYSASKGAIIGMTLPLARDLGKFGIRVITLAPGIIATPMGKEINEKVAEMIKKTTPLDRLGDPKEIGHCVVSLCMNSYITGEVIRIDGGIRLPHI